MRSEPDIWAVVPVKTFAAAKSRLSPAFSAQFRQGFAHAMLEDVLSALSDVPILAGIIVATIDPLAARLARSFSAEIFVGAAEQGHTQSVMAVMQRLAREGRGGILTIPGDIPAVTANEITDLLCRHRAAPAFSIVPAHDRRGSNAIVMTPPLSVPLCFGDNSFEAHLAGARRRGIEPTIIVAAGIGLDIDRPADIEKLLAWPRPTRAAAFIGEACRDWQRRARE